MKKKKFNAFTLVELLAVIVILAIILIIAVPKITKVIEQSKKGALESSAKLIASSLETKYKEELALGTDDISTSSSKTCPDSMYDSTLYSCTYTLDSVTGKATVSLIGKTGAKFEKLGVDATTTEATTYEISSSNAVTITFDSQGGSEVSALSLNSGDTYGTLSKPTKSGVVFIGWYTEATGGTKVTSTDTVNSNTTLYAHYVETVEFSSSWKTTIKGKTVGTLTLSMANIKSIKFYDNTDNTYDTTGKTFIADVSSSSNNTIKAYGVVDSTDATKIDIDIVGDKLIAFPDNSSMMFYNVSNLNTIDFNDSVTTSNVTNMYYMFNGCSKLANLDLSSFDTSNVMYMYSMFYNCNSLTSLNISNFDTSSVTNMSEMFYNCSALASIDVSSFNTSNVTNMGSMFAGCSKLTSLDLSNFDTSNVMYMSYMFTGCNKLTSLNVSSFNTSKVTTMSYMFNSCSALTSIDVSSFNTSNVTKMSDMFSSCSALTSIDISNFNTSAVTDISYIFYSCSALTSITIPATNGNGISNDADTIYGSTTDVKYTLTRSDRAVTLK